MLSVFPPDILDEIWDLIGSVSEGFPTFSFILTLLTGSKSNRTARYFTMKYAILIHVTDKDIKLYYMMLRDKNRMT